MNIKFDTNVSRPEAISRYLLSAALIGSVFLAPATVPSWLALVACYPAFTAMLRWDPMHAVIAVGIAQARKMTRNTVFHNPTTI